MAEEKNLNIISDYSDIRSEKEILGMILRNNDLLDEQEIDKELFFYQINQDIFLEIVRLKDTYGSVGLDILSSALASNTLYGQSGGKDYLVDIYQMISISSFQSKLSYLNYLMIKRRLILISDNIKNKVESSDNTSADLEDFVSYAERQIHSFAESYHSKNKPFSIQEISNNVLLSLDKAMDKDSKITGAETGLSDLDIGIDGLKKSDLIIIASRPSMGKTALASTMAYNVANHYMHLNKKIKEKERQKCVLFFSLEMSKEQIGARVAGIHCNIKPSILSTGRDMIDGKFKKISKSKKAEIVSNVESISNMPLYVVDSSILTVNAISSISRRMSKVMSVGAIFVDYLQLVKASNRYSGQRVQEISEITQGLKFIAKELDVPVVALSQLSRSVESRDDKRPKLADLRESGSIEQDADIVLFLYREAYYLKKQFLKEEDSKGSGQIKESMDIDEKRDAMSKMSKYEKVKNIAEIIVSKNRNGPTGSIECFFDSEKMVFRNLAKEDFSNSLNDGVQIENNSIDLGINEHDFPNDYDNFINQNSTSEDKKAGSTSNNEDDAPDIF